MGEFFNEPGAYFIVDGQFGSTGKGLLASYIAHHEGRAIDLHCNNAGPNSGHTHYFGDDKTVLKQLPTAAVYRAQMGQKPKIYLTAGAQINTRILDKEIREYKLEGCVTVHPCAVHIKDEDVTAEKNGTIARVAGTRQGGGHALSRKVRRDPSSIMRWDSELDDGPWELHDYSDKKWNTFISLHEVSQGFSLGINNLFFPKVTSRECTVAAALSDACIAPQLVRDVAMVVRTYPIRVGNADGHSSGDWYPDQKETTWELLGVEPELTTVTKRVRRVASFSILQYRLALMANRPNLILVNFMQYVKWEMREEFAKTLRDEALVTLGFLPKFLYGYGPKVRDVKRNVE
jgi:adenylosuccinate synthase